MLYAYYGGMLWIGRKEYKKAADLLLHAITTPAAVVSRFTPLKPPASVRQPRIAFLD